MGFMPGGISSTGYQHVFSRAEEKLYCPAPHLMFLSSVSWYLMCGWKFGNLGATGTKLYLE